MRSRHAAVSAHPMIGGRCSQGVEGEDEEGPDRQNKHEYDGHGRWPGQAIRKLLGFRRNLHWLFYPCFRGVHQDILHYHGKNGLPQPHSTPISVHSPQDQYLATIQHNGLTPRKLCIKGK